MKCICFDYSDNSVRNYLLEFQYLTSIKKKTCLYHLKSIVKFYLNISFIKSSFFFVSYFVSIVIIGSSKNNCKIIF